MYLGCAPLYRKIELRFAHSHVEFLRMQDLILHNPEAIIRRQIYIVTYQVKKIKAYTSLCLFVDELKSLLKFREFLLR